MRKRTMKKKRKGLTRSFLVITTGVRFFFFSQSSHGSLSHCCLVISFSFSPSSLTPCFHSFFSFPSLSSAPYDQVRDASDARKLTMQRILTEESEDTVEEYLRQKYASGPTARWPWDTIVCYRVWILVYTAAMRTSKTSHRRFNNSSYYQE